MYSSVAFGPFTWLHNHRRYLILEHFSPQPPKNVTLQVTPHLFLSQVSEAKTLLSLSMHLPFGAFHINGITPYLVSYNWFLSLTTTNGISGSYGNSCLIIWKLPVFEIVLHYFIVPPATHKSLNFSPYQSTGAAVTCFCFYYSHPSVYELVSHCDFNLHSPNNTD